MIIINVCESQIVTFSRFFIVFTRSTVDQVDTKNFLCDVMNLYGNGNGIIDNHQHLISLDSFRSFALVSHLKKSNHLVNLFHLINSISQRVIHKIFCMLCESSFSSFPISILSTQFFGNSSYIFRIVWMLHFYVQASVLFHLIPMSMFDSFNILQSEQFTPPSLIFSL